MVKDKNHNAFKFFFLLLGLNFFYFLIYFYYLDAFVTPINLYFIVLATISYFLLLHFWRVKGWELISYLLVIVYLVFTLVNFAYFKVFGTFLTLNLNAFRSVNSSLLSFLFDYFYLIPKPLYLTAGLVLIGIFNAKFWYFRTLGKAKVTTFFNSTKITLRRTRQLSQVVLVILLFVIFNGASFVLANYFANNPRASWIDTKEQNLELGLWGNLYTNALPKNNEPTNLILTAPPVNHNEPSTPVVTKTLLEQTKDTLSSVKYLDAGRPSPLALPKFDTPPNFIFIQLESVADFAVNNAPSPMPFLQSLIKNNVSVPNFHSNSCETINAEFSTLCSFYPNSFEPVSYSHLNNDYLCLPDILETKHGYETYFFHANDQEFWRRDVLTKKWGFNNQFFVPYFKQKDYDGLVMKEMFKILQGSNKPFLGYFVSFTSHSPHNDELIKFYKKNKNITITPFTSTVNSEYSNAEIPETEMRKYFGFLTAVDNGLKDFFTDFNASPLAKNTIVVIFNDHRYYNFKGNDLTAFNLYNQIPMVMVFPDKSTGLVQNIASQVDLAPTVLNLVEQGKYERPKNFVGESLYSQSFVNQAFNKCLGQVYYVNDQTVVKGNAKTNQYSIFHETTPLSSLSQSLWKAFVNKLTLISDATIFENALLK